MNPDCIEIPSGRRIDVSILEGAGFIGLERGLRTGRPRFPYCSRPWCPGNRAYLCDKGYYTSAASHGPCRVKVYGGSVRSVIASRFYEFISAGFQHSSFIRRIWHVMWRPIVRFSSHERLSAEGRVKPVTLDVIDVDVLVVGGGLAGLEASISASKADARVLLVEYGRLGGFVRLLGYSEVFDRIQRVNSDGKIKLLEGYSYIGLFSEGHVIAGKGRVIIVRPRGVVYATGSVSPPPLTSNNDLPGIVSLDYGLELVNEGYRPDRVVVVGDSYWSLEVARVLASMGIRVTVVSVERLSKVSEELASESGIEVIEGEPIVGFKGLHRVEGTVLADGRVIAGGLVFSGVEEYPDANPVYGVGVAGVYCDGRGIIVPRTGKFLDVAPGIYVAGSVSGDQGYDEVILGAKLAGMAAAHVSGYGDLGDVESVAREYWKVKSYGCGSNQVAYNVKVWVSGSTEGLQYVDSEAEVTLSDLLKAWEAGYRSMEKIKRITGLGTGLEQGRISAHTASLLLSRLYGVPVASIGLFRSRPPHMLPAFEELLVGGVQ